MSTVSDITRRALRLINVLDSNESPESQQSDDAIMALNAMMTRWEADGRAMGWSDVANPSDTMPTPPEADQAIAANLAVLLSPEYDAAPSPILVAMADNSLRSLQRDRLMADPIRTANDLPRASRGGRWDMYTNSWIP